jgi:hypothetical protein
LRWSRRRLRPGRRGHCLAPTAGTRWRTPSRWPVRRVVLCRHRLLVGLPGPGARRRAHHAGTRRCWPATSTATRPPGVALRALAELHGAGADRGLHRGHRFALPGRPVGSFGDVAVFDFSQPSALCCGEGGMLVTDDAALAAELRYLRCRTLADRRSVSVGARVPLQAGMSELTAALGLAQLSASTRSWRAASVEAHYLAQMQLRGHQAALPGADVDEVHWMLYVVHLGKRFTASACAQIVDDLATEGIEAAPVLPALCTSSLPTRSWAGSAAAAADRTHRRPRAGAAAARPSRRPRAVHRQDAEGLVAQRGRRRRHLLKHPDPWTLFPWPFHHPEPPAPTVEGLEAGTLAPYLGPGLLRCAAATMRRRPTRWRWPRCSRPRWRCRARSRTG